MTDSAAVDQAEPGTIDNPAATTVPAEYYIDKSGPVPALVVTLDLAAVGVGPSWQYDHVLDVGSDFGTDLTICCVPQGDDEGYDRLADVGEW